MLAQNFNFAFFQNENFFWPQILHSWTKILQQKDFCDSFPTGSATSWLNFRQPTSKEVKEKGQKIR